MKVKTEPPVALFDGARNGRNCGESAPKSPPVGYGAE
jgi:hypothetical protein